MNLKYIILLLAVATTLTKCAGEKKTTYDIPAYLPPERKAELLTNLEKGKVLFKANCSGCHGIFSKGKDSIPNFTEKEIVNYMSAYQTNDVKNHSVIKKLLPEEMSMIMTFLKMRNFKGKPVH
jgi:cytochrome c553